MQLHDYVLSIKYLQGEITFEQYQQGLLANFKNTLSAFGKQLNKTPKQLVNETLMKMFSDKTKKD